MIIFKQRFAGLILFCVMSGFSLFSFAQTAEIKGKIKKDNKPSGGVTIQITGAGITPQTVTSKENGSFSFVLDLQKSYSITFSKAGLVSKLIEFSTKLPPDQADIIYQFDFNLDLFDDLAGVSHNDAMTKPVARISYNPTYENFMDDENYTRKIRAEQEAARKAAEEIHRQQEKVRLDSLNKIWNDSLARLKSRETQSMADKTEQDRLRIEKEKSRQDSIAKANTAAQAAATLAAKEKARLDKIAMEEAKIKALAESNEKARQDSILKARDEKNRLELLRAARGKATQDSIARANADKNHLDSIAAVKDAAATKIKLEAETKSREKSRLDSIARAESALKARQKFSSDSLTQAKTESERQRVKEEASLKEKEKQKLDSLSKAQADTKRADDEAKLREKTRQDLLSKALASEKQRKKQVEDSTATAVAAQQKQQAFERSRLEAGTKARQDSIAAANEAAKARQKAIADSTQKVLADANAKNSLKEQARIKKQQDSLALAKENEIKMLKEAEEKRRQSALRDKASQDSLVLADATQRQKAEAERLKKNANEKAKQDSLAVVQRARDEKEEQERKAKVQAEIEAKKQMLAKANKVEEKAPPIPKVVAPVPKIRDSDYREGVTEETVNETTRVIYRTVVKKDGAAYNYQKIVYNWGGIFYFKNENIITEISFEQDIKNAKEKK